MTEQIVIDFLEGKLKGTKTKVCFGSLSCPSDTVESSERHPARDCEYFAICNITRGDYEKFAHLY